VAYSDDVRKDEQKIPYVFRGRRTLRMKHKLFIAYTYSCSGGGKMLRSNTTKKRCWAEVAASVVEEESGRSAGFRGFWPGQCALASRDVL
jgi:hypothetical protein